MPDAPHYNRPYQSPGPPPGGYFPPAPPKKSSTTKIVLIVLAVLAVCAAGGLFLVFAGAAGVSNQIEKQAVVKLSHVTMDSCERTVIGTVEVGYTIVNSSDQEQDYNLKFSVMSGSTRVGEIRGFESDVRPGATVKGTAGLGTVTADKNALLRCMKVEA